MSKKQSPSPLTLSDQIEFPEREKRNTLIKTSQDPKTNVNNKLSKAMIELTNRIKEHENNRNEINNRIDEIGEILRYSVTRFENKLKDLLETHYKSEEERLQSALDNLKEAQKNTSQSETAKVLEEAEGALAIEQKYVFIQPKHGNVIEWVHDTLFKEFYIRIGQSLTEHSISGRTPTITEVTGAASNEIEITIDFLRNEEIKALSSKTFWKGIDFSVEMWNGEKDESYEIRNIQDLGLSNKAFIEWRFKPNSDVKIRSKAAWNGIDGSRRNSSWGDWVTFTAPSDVKNGGVKAIGLVWDRRHRGEMYTLTDKMTKSVLYNGPKPYFLVMDNKHKKNVVVRGVRGDDKWEDLLKVRPLAETPEDILNDLRLFFMDLGICKRTLAKIAALTHCK